MSLPIPFTISLIWLNRVWDLKMSSHVDGWTVVWYLYEFVDCSMIEMGREVVTKYPDLGHYMTLEGLAWPGRLILWVDDEWIAMRELLDGVMTLLTMLCWDRHRDYIEHLNWTLIRFHRDWYGYTDRIPIFSVNHVGFWEHNVRSCGQGWVAIISWTNLPLSPLHIELPIANTSSLT